MKKLLIPLVSVGLAFGCGPEAPTSTDGRTANLAVAGNSGCYTPTFNVAVVPTGPATFEGPFTGDLEGTVSVQFTSSNPFTGVTIKNFGTAHWTVTGGIIPGLETFDTEFDNRNLLIDRPGSPATLFENLGTHRAVGGVEKANLTYNGTFSVVPPPPQTDHDYRGVICP